MREDRGNTCLDRYVSVPRGFHLCFIYMLHIHTPTSMSFYPSWWISICRISVGALAFYLVYSTAHTENQQSLTRPRRAIVRGV
ncbi:hypothetical protein F5Y12DRAFT_125260 [Xylaria sp. FL1777]|nr:hypothetical protein F5Y12DRAFT_125260 [Xylaria sp. FL1777]